MTIPEAKRRWQTIDGFIIDTMRVMECRPQRPEAVEAVIDGKVVWAETGPLITLPRGEPVRLHTTRLDEVVPCPTCGKERDK